MTRVYAWTEDEDEIALDAITVGIRSDTRILKVGGLQFGQRDAVIYWPDWTGGGTKVEAAIVGPFSVQDALDRAEQLCMKYRFRRVVIWLQHRELWDESWGKLASAPAAYPSTADSIALR